MDGPTIQDIEISYGNESSPVLINCSITCLNNASENGINLYNPAVTLVADRDSETLEVIRPSDTNTDLYQRIEYTQLSSCVQAMDESQHLYKIYPTVDTNRSVVRCAVHYKPTGQMCLGESVIVIRYVNSTIEEECPTPTPSVCKCTTTDCGMTTDTPTCTNVTRSTSLNPSTSSAQILGASMGTVISLLILAVVVLLSVMFGCRIYNWMRGHSPVVPVLDEPK